MPAACPCWSEHATSAARTCRKIRSLLRNFTARRVTLAAHVTALSSQPR
jgi:hypothetical protein